VQRGRIGFGCLSWLSCLAEERVSVTDPGDRATRRIRPNGLPRRTQPPEVVNAYTG